VQHDSFCRGLLFHGLDIRGVCLQEAKASFHRFIPILFQYKLV
jgi:hypothetical protein